MARNEIPNPQSLNPEVREKIYLFLVVAALIGSTTFFILNEISHLILAILVGIPFLIYVFYSPVGAAVCIIGGRMVIDLTMTSSLVDGAERCTTNCGVSHGSFFSIFCAALALWHLRSHVNQIRKHKFFTPLIFLLCLIAIAIPRATSLKEAAIVTPKVLIPFIVFFFIYTTIKSHMDSFKVLMVISLFSIVPMAISLFHLLNNQMDGHVLSEYNRLIGGYSSLRLHGLSMYLFACVHFVVYASKQLRNWRFVFFVLAALCVVFLYFTHMRSAQLILAVTVLIFFVFSKRWLTLTSVAIFLISVTILSPTIQDRFQDLLLVFTPDQMTFDQVQEIGSGRYLMWSRSIPIFLQQDFFDITFGLGVGKHVVLAQSVFDPFSDIDGNSTIQNYIDPHNNILFLLFQFGPMSLLLIGFILYKSFMVGVWLAQNAPLAWMRTLGSMVAAMVVGFVFNDSVSNGFIDRPSLSMIFWPIVATAYKLKHMLENSNETDAPAETKIKPRPRPNQLL